MCCQWLTKAPQELEYIDDSIKSSLAAIIPFYWIIRFMKFMKKNNNMLFYRGYDRYRIHYMYTDNCYKNLFENNLHNLSQTWHETFVGEKKIVQIYFRMDSFLLNFSMNYVKRRLLIKKTIRKMYISYIILLAFCDSL